MAVKESESLYINSVALFHDVNGFTYEFDVRNNTDFMLLLIFKLRSLICYFGGLGAKPPAARSWGSRAMLPAAGSTGVWGQSPQRSKILHFFAKIT